jgi:hypothetical protein
MQHAHTSLLSDSIVCYRMLLSELPNILEIVWGPIGALLMTTLHALVSINAPLCYNIWLRYGFETFSQKHISFSHSKYKLQFTSRMKQCNRASLLQ